MEQTKRIRQTYEATQADRRDREPQRKRQRLDIREWLRVAVRNLLGTRLAPRQVEGQTTKLGLPRRAPEGNAAEYHTGVLKIDAVR